MAPPNVVLVLFMLTFTAFFFPHECLIESMSIQNVGDKYEIKDEKIGYFSCGNTICTPGAITSTPPSKFLQFEGPLDAEEQSQTVAARFLTADDYGKSDPPPSDGRVDAGPIPHANPHSIILPKPKDEAFSCQYKRCAPGDVDCWCCMNGAERLECFFDEEKCQAWCK